MKQLMGIKKSKISLSGIPEDHLIKYLILFGAIIRFLIAPFSASEDLLRWWMHAIYFLTYGSDFYYYDQKFGKAPIWLFISAFIYLIVSPLTDSPDTPIWKFTIKIPLIFADLATGYLLYKIFKDKKGLKAAALYIFNPVAIYVSAIYGQIDPLLVFFLLYSVYMLEKNQVEKGFY